MTYSFKPEPNTFTIDFSSMIVHPWEVLCSKIKEAEPELLVPMFWTATCMKKGSLGLGITYCSCIFLICTAP